MGKKLDALLGRNFKTTKFKTLVNLAISRLAVLKNQRQVRCSQARSDVAQLLNLGHQERALLRVEHVIKEQNMLDVFVTIEGYCHLLIERVVLIQNNKECPDELKEATSSLIFAASRCGEFPELQEIRWILTSRFGKEFASRAVELRNGCEVNPKMIQKFSTRQPSLEIRMKILKEVASENGITLHLEEEQKPKPAKPYPSSKLEGAKVEDEIQSLTEEIERDEQFSGSMKTRKKYRDVVTAAQAAFESAAYAAAAAKAAVELSRSESQDHDDQNNHTPRWEVDHSIGELGFENIHPTDDSGSDSEGDEVVENHGTVHTEEFKEGKNRPEFERWVSASNSDSAWNTLKENKMSENQKVGKDMDFDESDDETKDDQGTIPWFGKSRLPTNTNENDRVEIHYPFEKRIPIRSQPDQHKNVHVGKLVIGSGNEDPGKGRSMLESTHHLDSEEEVSAHRSSLERKPVSVRTRRVHRP